MKVSDYPAIVEPLSEEDGGGFVAYAPDLPGCMSDGATQEEAIANLRDAILAWIEEADALGRSLPEPHLNHPYAKSA
jgi:antitoxin HicB